MGASQAAHGPSEGPRSAGEGGPAGLGPPHSHTQSHTHSVTRAHSHTYPYMCTLTNSHTVTHTLSHTHLHKHCHSQTHTHACTLTHTHSHSCWGTTLLTHDPAMTGSLPFSLPKYLPQADANQKAAGEGPTEAVETGQPLSRAVSSREGWR